MIKIDEYFWKNGKCFIAHVSYTEDQIIDLVRKDQESEHGTAKEQGYDKIEYQIESITK